MKQLCIWGHDTKITGRDTKGYCRACKSRCTKERRSTVKYDYIAEKRRTRESAWKHWGIINQDGTPFKTVDFDRRYQIQQGCCAVCERHQSNLGRTLSADHDHQTKIIRGLLCIDCNRKIAGVDDSNFLERARNYLGMTI